ncbi:hypothetical protein ACIRU8_34735 [Streptomyces sp. NPDC101175]|uniref:hypothetical protein n=1 Tax=Streptomyces sp. NPDC101175 TaxID=3366123 RepID=UPI0038352AEB
MTAAAARRSDTARGVARRRRREVLARIAAEPIDVPRLTPEELATLAAEYRDETGVVGGRLVAGNADPCGLDRLKVNFLRHRLARYEELLKGLHGGTGRAAADELLQRRVYGAIAEAYPFLAGECERQLSERAEKRMRARPST